MIKCILKAIFTPVSIGVYVFLFFQLAHYSLGITDHINFLLLIGGIIMLVISVYFSYVKFAVCRELLSDFNGK